MSTRLALSIAALLLAAPAAAQVQSNIQDDPRSSECSENCIDAGYEWAIANTPDDERDCEAANAEFAAGCDHWVQEQRDLAAPTPEEPVATDATGSAPMDDSGAPPPEDGQWPTEDSGAPVEEAPIEPAPADNGP